MVSSRVLILPVLQELEELLSSSFLKETHEGRSKSLASVRRDLGDGRLGALALLHVAASNLLEVEVLGNVGGNEDVGEFAVGHEKLRDEVDVPVVDTTVLFPWLALGLAVPLEKLSFQSAS